MTRGKKNGRSKGNRNKGTSLDHVVSMPFRTAFSAAFSDIAGVTITEVDLLLANLGARAVAAGSAFEYFRFSKLRAYQYTTVVNAGRNATDTHGILTGRHALAFVPSSVSTTGAPTTLTQMGQYEKFQIGHCYEKLHINVARDQIADVPFKWYSTAGTGVASDELSPGTFIIAAENGYGVADSDAVASCVIEGVVEFRGMITPALAVDKSETKTIVVPAHDSPTDGFVPFEKIRSWADVVEEEDKKRESVKAVGVRSVVVPAPAPTRARRGPSDVP